MMIWVIRIAFMFFKRKRETPLSIIGYLKWLLGLSVALSLLETLLLGRAVIGSVGFGFGLFELLRPVIGSSVAAAIWIPYFRKSDRVKRTFLR